MGLLDLFSQDTAGTGLLSPQDHLMALFAGLSKAGAAMSQPGLSRGAQVAQGLGALGPGMQEAQQAALMQGLLGQKLKESQQQGEWKKTLADAFGGSGVPGPQMSAAPGQTVAQDMATRMNGQRADTLSDPKVQGAIMGLYGPTGLAALRAEDKAAETKETFDDLGRKIIRQWNPATKRYDIAVGGAQIDPEKLQMRPDGTAGYVPGAVSAQAGLAGAKAGSEAWAKSPAEAWLAWQKPVIRQPGADVLDLSGAAPTRPGAMPGGPPMLPGAPGAGPRTVVKAPVEWATDPANPGLQVSSITGERRAIPPGVTDDKEGAKNTIISLDQAIKSAQELLQHPGRQAGTGKSYLLSYVPGTDAYDFGAKLETLKAQVWLPMVEKMRGMGALSDAEGKKLAGAFEALDPKMTEAGFEKSLNDALKQLQAGRERMMTKTQTGYLPQPSALPGNPADLTKLSDDEVLKRLGIR